MQNKGTIVTTTAQATTKQALAKKENTQNANIADTDIQYTANKIGPAYAGPICINIGCNQM